MIDLSCGDCLEVMKDIPDKSIDLVLCDLPYGVLNKSNNNTQWDNVIPFDKLWEQYSRIVKDNGVVALFGSGKFFIDLVNSNYTDYRYEWVWDKGRKTGFLDCNKRPLKQIEYISIFYKSTPKYHPQFIICSNDKKNHSKGIRLKEQSNNCYGNFKDVPTTDSNFKYPSNLIYFDREHKNNKFFHPTQKPVALLEYLIKTYTDDGDLVLDNCMGSGSTGVACKNLNRSFIGIEIDENYFNIAKQRIELGDEFVVKKEDTKDDRITLW